MYKIQMYKIDQIVQSFTFKLNFVRFVNVKLQSHKLGRELQFNFNKI